MVLVLLVGMCYNWCVNFDLKGVWQMRKNKAMAAFLTCVILFCLVLGIVTVMSRADSSEDSSPRIIISEVLSNNRTCPAPNGAFLDFIEIHNTTDSPVDISGYMLSDDVTSIGYTFPQGSIISAGGYTVCWCDKTSNSGNYANFGISSDGTDTVYLYNSSNVLIDQVAVPALADNTSLIRSDSDWLASSLITPGFENTDAGFAAWLDARGAETYTVAISEVMTGNTCTWLNDKGLICDFIELVNTGSAPVDLDGAYLSDDPDDPLKWQIQSLTIQPGEYVLIPCSGSGENGEASFSLPRSRVSVVLTGPMGNTIALVDCPTLSKDSSWALNQDGIYEETAFVTPGSENSDDGYAAWLQNVSPVIPQIVISEVMSSNRSTLLSAAGHLADWVELTNTGTTDVSLDGMYLSDDPAEKAMWKLSGITLAPGERTVIFCAGDSAEGGEASFALSSSGCTLTLTGNVGNIISQIDVPQLEGDRVWALQSDGSYLMTDLASPGYENSEAGYLSFRNSQMPRGPLVISEVMSSNNRYLRQSDGKYHDWVEIHNISDSPVNLSDYYLSDSADKHQQFRLPEQVLESGERLIVICSGDASIDGKYVHAPFSLNYEECWVYLSDANGSFSDYIRVYDVPYQGSAGRDNSGQGTYYFTTPTPGADNAAGVSLISASPVFETKGGVYDDVDAVTAVLQAPGEIHYTTNGSLPTQNDPLYTGPLTLTKTTVIRAAAFEHGKLRSDVITETYIINEYHTLPVISISAPDSSLFGTNGIYKDSWVDKEVPCHLALYENGEGFSIDCGIEMFGHTNLSMPKKSFKVQFRSVYGSEVLGYPVYGTEGPQVYEALVIRGGQDYPRAIIRDELFTSLCRQMGDNVLAQRDKFSILYINGEYFGIYSMKEAFSEAMYAENKGVSKESVTMIQAPVGASSDIFKLRTFCMKNDMTKAENYEYVASKIDIDSLIDWMIIQGYSTNGDIQQNLRYFRSTENGNKWQFAYYDLDWTFYEHVAFSNVLDPNQPWQHKGITRNMVENPEFRQKFIERVSYLLTTTLSEENVLAQIDYYENLLDPEVKRERQRWNGNYSGWKKSVQALRNFIVEGQHMDNVMTRLVKYLGLTKKELANYFPWWDGTTKWR